ncbi:leukemia inhibitory factor receptor isoform X2 [Rhinatrema bivittatum]|uniref:leukemia inhibitory factor receptor isoform X2 n=1 Tax=Rhinatrema bivittatum TaxID=194408 RepID=UPI001129CDB9|nr:leukemia inhibitory factor receptor isoform X2 [Rhinatrema bivittatum]
MWHKLYFLFLLATVLSCLLNCLHCQERGSPEGFKCVTHNLETWICSWDASPNTSLKTVYEVCSNIRDLPQCVFSEENSIEIKDVLFAEVEIKITAKNDLGSTDKTFRVSAPDVALVPDTPEILTLAPDFESSTFIVEWKMNFPGFTNGSQVIWEIKILQNENVISTVPYITTWTEQESIVQWKWMSDLPLECADHSVKIRSYIDEAYFPGHKEWSDWSVVKTIPGHHDSLQEPTVFPESKVVPVGSNVMFCCVAEHLTSITYGVTHYTLIHLSNYSSAIKVNNVNMSEASGTNVICYLTRSPGIVGAVIFVGYPPDTPQDFNCETRDLKKIICSWNPGRPTGLYGGRETKYILHERISGVNVSCANPEVTKELCNCFFDVINNQNLYNFTLRASNPLNSSEASSSIDVIQRVHSEAPSKIAVADLSSRSIQLSWFLSGKFTLMRLQCQINISIANEETEPRNASMDGAIDSYYFALVDELHPFTAYVLSVRCSTLENFWKWSEWSHEKKHTTLAAPPSGKLIIWRENIWNSEGRNLIIYWKPLSNLEANGRVHSHIVLWKESDENSQFKNISIPSPYNRTLIFLHNDDKIYIINVVANNSAGLSPPATIKSSELPNKDVKIENVIGNKDGITVTWDSNTNVSCGYIVQWRPSFGSQFSDLQWETFSSEKSSALLTSAPKVAPNATVEQTTSDSVQIKWDDIPAEYVQGFMQGYLVYVTKQENGTSKSSSLDLGRSNTRVKNITDTSVKVLTINDLQGRTSYHVELQAYTRGGKSPLKSLYVVTNDNSVGLILASLMPVAVALLFGVVTSTICYQKREWIKETFYPDIPNPENSKALQFQKNISEENTAVKTLEMNRCTPNNVEVVETLATVPKIMDTELTSPVGENEDLDTHLPEYDSDPEGENHVVISYCPPIMDEEISSPPIDETVGSSQVTYIDIQSMYQPQAKSEEKSENEFVHGAGYKPQMQLSINTATASNHTTTEDDLEQSAGYRPQVNVTTWNVGSPCSSSSTDSNSENASFGSPCSINSRHFLIPPEEDQDTLKPTHAGWSFTSLFQNKPDD